MGRKRTNNQQGGKPPVDSSKKGRKNKLQSNTPERKNLVVKDGEVVVISVRRFEHDGKPFLPLRRYSFKEETALLLASENKVRICK
jgi:hypothetical protein